MDENIVAPDNFVLANPWPGKGLLKKIRYWRKELLLNCAIAIYRWTCHKESAKDERNIGDTQERPSCCQDD